jgi:nicotinate-nucleotide adenylyltransferase
LLHHITIQEKSTLLDDYHRLQMAHLATEDFPKLKPSDIEFKLSQPYTVNTLVHLEKYPNHEFSLIMGKTTTSLSKWKNFNFLQNHAIYVYRIEAKDRTGEYFHPSRKAQI